MFNYLLPALGRKEVLSYTNYYPGKFAPRSIIGLLEIILCAAQGRIPGTKKWKPVKDDPEAEEDVPGALIVRIRDDLDFGKLVLSSVFTVPLD